MLFQSPAEKTVRAWVAQQAQLGCESIGASVPNLNMRVRIFPKAGVIFAGPNRVRWWTRNIKRVPTKDKAMAGVMEGFELARQGLNPNTPLAQLTAEERNRVHRERISRREFFEVLSELPQMEAAPTVPDPDIY